MLTKNGALITDVRGKLGGQVYSKNRYGSFVANTYKPTNPQTIAQQQNRVYLSRSVAAWKQLSEAERLSWNSAAVYLKGVNCFGDAFSYTAYQCYIKCSLIYLAYNNDHLTSCPLISMPKPFRYFSFIIDLEQNTFTLTVNASGIIGLGVAVYATRPLKAGRKPKASDYRRFFINGSINLDDNVLTDYYVNYFGRFPSPGEYVYMKLCTVDSKAGLLSMPFFASAVCSSYLKDITPYNLQQASYDSSTKVLSLKANSTAFAHLATIIDASYFSMSFRVLSFGVSNPFRFALSSSPSYKIWNSTDNHYRWSLYTINSAFQCTKQSLVIGQCIAPSNSDYFVLSVKNGTAYVYFGSSLQSLSLISQFSWDASGLYYLNVTNATAYAVQIDSLKLSQ